MRLVDSSAWIEFLAGSDIGRLVAQELPSRENWLVPTMVQLQLAKWFSREGLEDTADELIVFSETCVVADLDTQTTLAAAELCARHELTMADEIVYAIALAFSADLLTCDAHFETLPFMRFVSKAGHAADHEKLITFH